MTCPDSRPDRIDFSRSTFHGKVVGKEEHHYHPHTDARKGVPHNLPSAPSGFIGRQGEVEELLSRLNPCTDIRDSTRPGATDVSALSGMGGVGKTALALHAAGLACTNEWFCAELFVDLHGFTPGTTPLNAMAALDSLLRQLGVDPDDIPNNQDERAALYRSTLRSLSREDPEGRPVLVVADNAYHLSQIEPLLPGPGGHRFLVTSRERLAVDGFQPVALDLLTREEAIQLLTSRLGNDDLRSQDRIGVGTLVERCGFLPLALKIAAALLARTPHLEPGHLAQRLSRASTFQDSRDHLPTVFAASLNHLPADRVEAFALLGSNPGPDISTAAAGILTGLDPGQVEEALEELSAAHMLTSHPDGRWSMHDLLADYACTLDPPSEMPDLRQQKVKHLLGSYSFTVLEADKHLHPSSDNEPTKVFSNRESALAWLDSERDNLIASVYAAKNINLTSVPFHTALFMQKYLEIRRYFNEAIDVLAAAREAAQSAKRMDREAQTWNRTGGVLLKARRFEESVNARYHAIDLHRAIGDIYGEATAWNGLGFAFRELERFDEAITALAHAQILFQDLGDRQGEAMAAGNLGATFYQLHRTEEAINILQQANTLFRQIDDHQNESLSAMNLGAALRQSGRIEEAIDILYRARCVQNEINDIDGEALTWTNLGVALTEAGRIDEAVNAHQSARDLFIEIRDMHGEAMTWDNIGLIMSKLKHFDNAASCFAHARDLNQQIGNIKGEAHVTRRLGDALRDSRRLNEAIDEFRFAIDLHQQAADTNCEGKSWDALGTTFVLAHRFDDAISALTQAISILHQSGDEEGEAGAWNNLFHALTSTGRKEEAQYARKKAIQMHNHIGTPLAIEIVEHLSNYEQQRSLWNFWKRRFPHIR